MRWHAIARWQVTWWRHAVAWRHAVGRLPRAVSHRRTWRTWRTVSWWAIARCVRVCWRPRWQWAETPLRTHVHAVSLSVLSWNRHMMRMRSPRRSARTSTSLWRPLTAGTAATAALRICWPSMWSISRSAGTPPRHLMMRVVIVTTTIWRLRWRRMRVLAVVAVGLRTWWSDKHRIPVGIEHAHGHMSLPVRCSHQELVTNREEPLSKPRTHLLGPERSELLARSVQVVPF